MSYIFILYNEHGPHSVFYNVTKYQSSIFTLRECSGGVNETRVEWKCVPESLALGPLSGGVFCRLQLLFCVVHIDYQSILFFGHWYAYACILLMYLIIFKQKTALKQNRTKYSLPSIYLKIFPYQLWRLAANSMMHFIY